MGTLASFGFVHLSKGGRGGSGRKGLVRGLGLESVGYGSCEDYWVRGGSGVVRLRAQQGW